MGRVEMADGGTLFVDEIGELSWELQAKLLQVVQEGKFSPLGSTSQKKVDVRVICSTSHKREEAVKNKNFAKIFFTASPQLSSPCLPCENGLRTFLG